MVTQNRLSSEERRDAIVHAALPLFAEAGFDRVTTREIAQAAGVSEALLYRHFPSKRALYEAIQDHCVVKAAQSERLKALPDNTQTLVAGIYLLMWKIHCGPLCDDEERRYMTRLNAQSLLGDGSFTRQFLDKTSGVWVDKITRCLEAARAAGDLDTSPEDAELGGWLAHHVAVALSWFALPREPVVDYPGGTRALLDRSVQFCLRGIGLRPAAIERYFNPAMFAVLVDG